MTVSIDIEKPLEKFQYPVMIKTQMRKRQAPTKNLQLTCT